MLATSRVEATMSFMFFALSNRKDSCEVKNLCWFSALLVFGAVTGAFPLGSKYAANLILDAEWGEVLVDSRGLGSFQR